MLGPDLRQRQCTVQGALLLGGDSVSGSDHHPHKDIMAGHCGPAEASSHPASLLFSVIGKVSQFLGMMNTGLSHTVWSPLRPLIPVSKGTMQLSPPHTRHSKTPGPELGSANHTDI